MTSNANVRVLRRFIDEAFNQGNLTVVDDVVADDFVDHRPPSTTSGDKVGKKEVVRMFRTAFPDLRVTVEDAVAEGDTDARDSREDEKQVNMYSLAVTQQHIENAFQELRGWYREVPALELTVAEASALVTLHPRACLAVLDALVHSNFLEQTALGTYVRRARRSVVDPSPATSERLGRQAAEVPSSSVH